MGRIDRRETAVLWAGGSTFWRALWGGWHDSDFCRSAARLKQEPQQGDADSRGWTRIFGESYHAQQKTIPDEWFFPGAEEGDGMVEARIDVTRIPRYDWQIERP